MSVIWLVELKPHHKRKAKIYAQFPCKICSRTRPNVDVEYEGNTP